MLQKLGFDNQPYRLVDANGDGVWIGDCVTDFRGQGWVVRGGTPPHKPGSTGRVWVADEDEVDEDGSAWEREVFPSVVDLEWVRVED